MILLKITAARTGFGIAKGAAKFSGNLCKLLVVGSVTSLMLAAGKAASAAAAQHNASGLTPISTSSATFRGAMSYAGHSIGQHVGDALYSGFIKK